MPGTVAAAYAAFAPSPADARPEPGFPPGMPYYYRHASHFGAHTHVRALMRLRCCSDPFAASPTLHYGGPPVCPSCAARARADPGAPDAPPETAEHALLDCETYATLRADPCFSHLFSPPLAPAARLRAFVRLPDQHALAAFVHECFEIRSRVV